MRVTGLARLTLVLSAAGCALTSRREADATPDFSGLYLTTQTDQVAVCSPRPLPASLAQDSATGFSQTVTHYEPFLVRVEQQDSQLRVTPLDKDRQPLAKPFAGTLKQDGSYTVTRNLTEGAAHGFSIEQEARAGGTFELAGASARFTASGKFRYLFREDSHTDSVFTTCTVAIAASGTRQ
jgi:hypothetical protein